MSIIYKITNNINGKIYVGKTEMSLEHRFQYHIYDSKKSNIQGRPLYLAMNKYGIENFTPAVLEEVKDRQLLDEREKYWIQKLDTYRNGYNATLGGDGTAHIDRDKIIELHHLGYNNTQIAYELKASRSHISRVIKSLGLTSNFDPIKENAVPVTIEKDNIIITFSSYMDAAKYFINNNISRSKKPDSVATQLKKDRDNNILYFGWNIY